MKPKSKSKLAIILGIAFGLALITTLLIIAIVKDFTLKGWMLGFVLPIGGIILLGIIVLIVYKLRKIKKEPEKLIQEIDPKDAEELLDDVVVENYGTNFFLQGSRTMNIGRGDVEKTPILHRWGICKGGDSRIDGSDIHAIINLKQPSKISIIIPKLGEYVDLKESIEALAEHPKIEETEEDIISTDEMGRPIRRRVRRKQTVEQRKLAEEEKEVEEAQEL